MRTTSPPIQPQSYDEKEGQVFLTCHQWLNSKDVKGKRLRNAEDFSINPPSGSAAKLHRGRITDDFLSRYQRFKFRNVTGEE